MALLPDIGDQLIQPGEYEDYGMTYFDWLVGTRSKVPLNFPAATQT